MSGWVSDTCNIKPKDMFLGDSTIHQHNKMIDNSINSPLRILNMETNLQDCYMDCFEHDKTQRSAVEKPLTLISLRFSSGILPL